MINIDKFFLILSIPKNVSNIIELKWVVLFCGVAYFELRNIICLPLKIGTQRSNRYFVNDLRKIIAEKPIVKKYYNT